MKNKLLAEVKSSWLNNLPNFFSFEIALSGGIDSVVLLDVFCQLRSQCGFNIAAVHVHHGLQEDADDWVEFCQHLCQRYGVPLRIEYVSVDLNSSLGIEAEARKQRYSCFMQSQYPCIVMAHHQDDQIETFLLSMLRGGGIRGMVAMQSVRALNNTVLLWRPFLHLTKSEIEQYASSQSLKFIQDLTNFNSQYLRNWVRYDLLDFIRKKVPHINQHILHNITNLQASLEIIDDLAKADFTAVSYDGVLLIEKLLLLPELRQREVLKYFLQNNELGSVSKVALINFSNWLRQNSQKTYSWQLANGEVYVYAGKIWPWSYSNPLRRIIEQGQVALLSVKWKASQSGLDASLLDNTFWALRAVNRNDKIRTEIGTQSVIKLLKNSKIPKFIRNNWPVMVNEFDQCIAVVGVKIDLQLKSTTGVLPYIEELTVYLSNLRK